MLFNTRELTDHITGILSSNLLQSTDDENDYMPRDWVLTIRAVSLLLNGTRPLVFPLEPFMSIAQSITPTYYVSLLWKYVNREKAQLANEKTLM